MRSRLAFTMSLVSTAVSTCRSDTAMESSGAPALDPWSGTEHEDQEVRCIHT